MATQAARGKKALEASDYPTAISEFSAAIAESSGSSTTSPLWLIQRSTAYHRISQYDLALKDAEAAYHWAVKRGKRDSMATAQFRRAVAYHGLGQYGNARLCLHWCSKLNEKERALTFWQAKVASDYEKAGGEQAECNKTTAVKEPEFSIDKGSNSNSASATGSTATASALTVIKETAVAPPKSAGTTIDKIRVEWYQSNTNVTIEILCKGVPKDQASIKFEEDKLLVKFPVSASNTDYEYNAAPLHQKIDAQKSSFRVTPHKIEIILVKAMAGLKWNEIYSSTGTATAGDTTQEALASHTPALATTTKTENTQEPLSSKDAPAPAPQSTFDKKENKNWDKILSTDNDDDDEEGDPMSAFFKKLYKDADPDTRRAMIKSYQESNGTSLSTSWGEVKDKKYETNPPDGVEAKKWDS